MFCVFIVFLFSSYLACLAITQQTAAAAALNLQDLKMADHERTKTEKAGLEND